MTDPQTRRIGAASRLPAVREDIELRTADEARLVGELAAPGVTRATVLLIHPLPSQGGSMDAHLFRKASWRLPALAGIAVLRFNLRGVTSRRGTSEGAFDDGRREGQDVRAAVEYAVRRRLPDPWLVGWSFGGDLILEHGCRPDTRGAILLAPPLRWCTAKGLAAWAQSGRPVHALVPEFDEHASPEHARKRLAPIPQAQVRTIPRAGHLLLGEQTARHVLDQIVRIVAPDVPTPLPEQWAGEVESVRDL